MLPPARRPDKRPPSRDFAPDDREQSFWPSPNRGASKHAAVGSPCELQLAAASGPHLSRVGHISQKAVENLCSPSRKTTGPDSLSRSGKVSNPLTILLEQNRKTRCCF